MIVYLQRYTSIGTVGMPHLTTCDTSIDGHRIPKGTCVLTNMWSLHHDKSIFLDPAEFKPERFLTNEGDLIPRGSFPRNHLLPFKAGPRSCVGESFSTTRMFLIATNTVKVFHILPASTLEQQPSCHPEDYESRLTAIVPPYNVRFKLRQQES